jgi:hypothetical protein
MGGGIFGYSRFVIKEISSMPPMPAISKLYKTEEFSIRCPPNWKIKEDKDLDITYLTPQEKRIPEEIWVFFDVVKREDLIAEPFYNPLNFFGKPVPDPAKVEIGNKEFYKSEEGFEAIRDIRYAIANEGNTRIGWITLSIRYGRQRMDYYIPDEELKPELEGFNKILSTFRFLD